MTTDAVLPRTHLTDFSHILRTAVLVLLAVLPVCSRAQNTWHVDNIKTNGCTVFCTFKDADGVMWVGTYNGLLTYSQLYSRNPFGFARHKSLETIISTIDQDGLGRLWLGTQDNRHFCYNPRTGELIDNVTAELRNIGIETGDDYRIVIDDLGRPWHYAGRTITVIDPALFQTSTKTKTKTIPSPLASNFSPLTLPDTIRSVMAKGSQAIVATNKQLYLVDTKTMQKVLQVPLPAATTPDHVYLWHGSHGDIWLANLQHLYRYDRKSGKWVAYQQQMFDIIGFATLDSGNTCVATTNCGLYFFDTDGNELRHITQQDSWLPGLQSNHLKSVYYDRRGKNLWLTYSKSDMSIVSEASRLMQTYHPLSQTSCPFNAPQDIIAIAQSPDGNVWIGTEDDGILQLSGNDYNTVLSAEHPGSTVTSIFFDSKGRRWTGFYRQGLVCSNGQRFFEGKSPYKIAEAPNGCIYVVLPGDGLWCINPDGKPSFLTSHITTDSQWLMELTISGNYLYVASPQQLCQIDTRTGKQSLIKAERFGNSNFNVGIKTLMADSRGWVWLVNYKNFSNVDIYDPHHDRTFSVGGLDYYYINSIAEDRQGNVWLTTDRGLVRVRIKDAEKPSFDTYCFSTPQGNATTYYNERAATMLANGTIAVGTTGGLSIIDPEKAGETAQNTPQPSAVSTANAAGKGLACPLICSSLQVNDIYIAPRREYDGLMILGSDLPFVQSIELNNSQNNLTLEYCPKDFTDGVARAWYYKLDGLDDDWHPMYDYRVILSNLSAGSYTLMLREKGLNADEQTDYRVLSIRIRQPFWLSWPAFLLYVLALALLSGLLYKYFRNRQLYRRQVREMEQEAAREAEINTMKMRFFTNISHDLRTPLTLIITPVEEMMNTVKDASLHDTLGIVYANARRLYHLVNQILDFRRIENTQPTLERADADIVGFVSQRLNAFKLMAQQNDIALSIDSDCDQCVMSFDKDKMGKAIDNLLSNALKFTPKGGKIAVFIGRNADNTVVSIADTGIGIPEEDRNHVFERFYVSQKIAEKGMESTGIGLHIVKEYVELHGGTVGISDNKPKGTVFTITLPIVRQAAFASTITAIPAKTATISAETTTASASELSSCLPSSAPCLQKSTLLLVEDNPDMLGYLSRMLGSDYTICQATDGNQALEVLRGTDIDLIVSDVMMEGMDGMELCRRLKSDIGTSHIPVILLTARALAGDELEGLRTGADDYIIKPFHLDILRQRIANLLERTRQARERFVKEPQIEPSEVTVTTLDEEFLTRAIQVVEQHIGEPSFSVDDLSEQMFMHRTNFYRKIQFITGKTPAQFIRILRLKRARQLLSRGNVLISQVAFQVGFNSPKKFARYFKEEFGQYPSEYARTMEKADETGKNDVF